MSAIDMASGSKFPYRRLGLKGGIDDDEGDTVIPRSKNCCRLRRLPIRRRFRVKVPSLRRLWRKKAARLVSALRISCANVIRRFKDGQVRFGDLFAGNYLFTQVNPASLKHLQK